MVIEKTQIIELYNSWGEPFDKEDLDELNKELSDMSINCEVSIKEEADGYSIRFKKTGE